jgi:hypothetical protein
MGPLVRDEIGRATLPDRRGNRESSIFAHLPPLEQPATCLLVPELTCLYEYVVYWTII